MVQTIRAEKLLVRQLERRRFITGAVAAAVIFVSTGVTVARFIPEPEADYVPTAALGCAECQLLLPRYDSGQLGPDAWEHVRNHLDECEVCRSRSHALVRSIRTEHLP